MMDTEAVPSRVESANSTHESASSSKASSPVHQRNSGEASPSSTQKPPSPGFVTPNSQEPADTSSDASEASDGNEESDHAEIPKDMPVKTEVDGDDEGKSNNEPCDSLNETSDKEIAAKTESSGEKQSSTEAETPKPDIDRDSRNPAFVPRSGRFFEHDDRNTDPETVEESESAPEAKAGTDDKAQSADTKSQTSNNATDVAAKRGRADASSRWSHDLFDMKQQAPKSSRELQGRYGQGYQRARRSSADREPQGDGKEVEEAANRENSDSNKQRGRRQNVKRHERDPGRSKGNHEAAEAGAGEARNNANRPTLTSRKPVQREAAHSEGENNDTEQDDERLAYDDAVDSDEDGEKQNARVDSATSSAAQRSKSDRGNHRQSKSSDREKANTKAAVKTSVDDMQVNRSQRARPRGRGVQVRSNYGHNFGRGSDYAYTYDYGYQDATFDNQRLSGRGRVENGYQGRSTNGARQNRDHAYFDYDYAAVRGQPQPGRARQPARTAAAPEFYYEDPVDSYAGMQSRGRGRATYTARSNRTGVDADRWLHDRADAPARAAINSASAARPNQRPPAPNTNADTKHSQSFGSNAKTPTQTQSQLQPSKSEQRFSNDTRQAKDVNRKQQPNAAERRPATAAEAGRNNEDRVKTNGPSSARSGQSNESSNHAKTNSNSNRNVATTSVGQRYEAAPSTFGSAPVAQASTVVPHSFSSPNSFYSVTPAQNAAGSAMPASNVVTSDQLNVLFDAFSAATAQFAPTVSSQILQTVAHTLMMHGASNSGTQSTGAAYTAAAADSYSVQQASNALGLPVGVGVGATAGDSTMLPLVGVPVSVLPTGTLLGAPLAPVAPTYSVLQQPPTDYSKPAPFSATAEPQSRRARAPLAIVDPKDLASGTRRGDSWKQSAAGAHASTSSGSVAAVTRADAR